MAHLLDYMYGNLAILKESKLLRFLCAARRLEIDCLQTPGLKSLETNLTRSLNATPCGASFSEGRETGGVTGGDRGGETSRNILLPNVKFPASLEITEKPKAIGGHSGDGRNCGATHSREQASERKNEENTGTKEQSKCCCHCSCRREGEAKSARVKESSDERSETKEGRTLSPEELEAETLRQKLEKCGTKITGNAMSMLQVPAWIFSSKNISITPAKEISKNVTVSAADQSTAGKAPLAAQGRTDETDAPVIIGTSPPKPPVPPKRNLMPAFQASPRLQGHGYFPKGDLRYPGPRGSHGGARGPHSVSQRYPGPRYMAPNINSVPRIQQNQRNRLQTPYPRMMPNAVPDRVPLTQKSSRGHGYGTPPPHRNIFNALGQSTPSSDAGNVSIRMDRKLSQQPRVIVNNILSSQGRSPHSPSGRGRRGRCSRGRRLSLLYPYSPSSDRDVTNQPGGSQDHANGLDEERPSPSGKSSLHWKWNEPVEVKDTGIIIQLPDNVAEVIAGAPVLTPAAPGLDNRRSLDFQLAESGPSSYRAPVSSVEGPSVEGPSMEGPSVEGPSSMPPSTAEQQIVQQNPLADNSAASSAPNESLMDATLPNESIPPHRKSSSFEGFSMDIAVAETQPQDPPQPEEGPGKEETSEGERKAELAKDENCSNAASAANTNKTRGRPKKTFRCPVCRMMFQNPSSLLMHQRQHTGERPRYCSSCSFRSESLTTLKSHVKRKHRRLLQDCEKVCHPAPEVEPNSLSKKKKKDKKEEERKEEVNPPETEKLENMEQGANEGKNPDQTENPKT
nr:uncharacterized protein LOC113825478 [Penaeus vannamei]